MATTSISLPTSSGWQRAVVPGIVLVASLIAAAVVPAIATGLSFGLQAARDAGENPPQEVSRRVESLLRWQAYANALLTGLALSSLLVCSERLLGAVHQDPQRLKSANWFRSVCRSLFIGGLVLIIACLAFRLQPVGTQDLPASSLIHGLLWAALGAAIAGKQTASPSQKQRIPLTLLAGFGWGASFPLLIVVLEPSAFVERLFSTSRNISVWAGIGCAVLLTAKAWENRRSRSSAPPGDVHMGAS